MSLCPSTNEEKRSYREKCHYGLGPHLKSDSVRYGWLKCLVHLEAWQNANK